MTMPVTAAPRAETVEERFQRLLRTWHAEVAHLSSTSRRIAHPAFQEIIGMGREAVPLLLREMERTKNGHLTSALQAILGVNPVVPEDHGKIAKVAETWLSWARENGIRW